MPSCYAVGAKRALLYAQSAVSCIEKGSKRSGENQKERLQYLAAGTATPQGAGYGVLKTRTDRVAR